MRRKCAGAVLMHLVCDRIQARQKARSARRADRALTIRTGECRAPRRQAVNIGSLRAFEPEALQGVPTLLIAANPDYTKVPQLSSHAL